MSSSVIFSASWALKRQFTITSSDAPGRTRSSTGGLSCNAPEDSWNRRSVFRLLNEAHLTTPSLSTPGDSSGRSPVLLLQPFPGKQHSYLTYSIRPSRFPVLSVHLFEDIHQHTDAFHQLFLSYRQRRQQPHGVGGHIVHQDPALQATRYNVP